MEEGGSIEEGEEEEELLHPSMVILFTNVLDVANLFERDVRVALVSQPFGDPSSDVRLLVVEKGIEISRYLDI